MSSSTQNVLTVDERTEPVAVQDKLGGAISRAQIDDNGVLREVSSGSTYPEGNFEILPSERSRPVIITQKSHSNCWHTSACKNMLDIAVQRRKIVAKEEGIEFYGMDHECRWCKKKGDAGADTLQQVANGTYNG